MNGAMPQAVRVTKRGAVRWEGSGQWWTVWLFSPGGVDLWKGTVCCVCCCSVSVITLNHAAINHPHSTAGAGKAAVDGMSRSETPWADQVHWIEKSEWLVRDQWFTDFMSWLDHQQSAVVCVCRHVHMLRIFFMSVLQTDRFTQSTSGIKVNWFHIARYLIHTMSDPFCSLFWLWTDKCLRIYCTNTKFKTCGQ